LTIILRRIINARSRIVTSPADWIVLILLLFQISTGLLTAVFESWGSTWFASMLAPYLWSLVYFNPDLAYITPLPLLVQLHIISAFVIILFFPFTRLVHVLVVPNPYLWRKPQMVRWYWDRKKLNQV
jgi:nitrate reductase gamma subunit